MKQYLHFISMHLKSRMAYKKSFFFSVVGQFLAAFAAVVTIWFCSARLRASAAIRWASACSARA